MYSPETRSRDGGGARRTNRGIAANSPYLEFGHRSRVGAVHAKTLLFVCAHVRRLPRSPAPAMLMHGLMLIVGGALGLGIRLLSFRGEGGGRDSPPGMGLVVTAGGAIVIGFLTGAASANAVQSSYAATASVGLSAALFTFCVFSGAAIQRLRGIRQATGPALTHGILGFTAATIGIIIGALALP